MKNLNLLALGIKTALFAGAITSVSAFAAEKDNKNVEEEEIERVEVTGSRIKRTDIEGASPITVISFDDIQKSGAVTVSDVLKNLSQNTGTIQGNEFSGGFTANVQAVNLRGFGPGYSLTLINGRRLANYPAAYNSDTSVVNTGAIPAAMVERIEILNIGASAIYGSDAVAGVMNIILKDDVEDTTITAMTGTRTGGAGNTHRLQAVTGFTGEKGNITAGFEYFKQTPVKGADVDWLDSTLDYPHGESYLDRAVLALDRWAPYTGKEYRYIDPGKEKCETSTIPSMEYAFRPGAGYFCGLDDVKYQTLRNESEKYSVSVTSNYELSDSVNFFADFMYYKEEARNDGGSLWFSYDEIGEPVSTPFGNLYNVTLYQRYIGPEELKGNGNSTVFDENAIAMSFGIEGDIGSDYTYKVTANGSRYNMESVDSAIREEVIKEMIFGAPGPNNGKSYFGTDWYEGTNRDFYQAFTQEELTRLVGNPRYENYTQNMAVSAEISGPAFSVGDHDAYFALVVEHVRDEYEMFPDERMLNLDGEGWYNRTGSAGQGKRHRSGIALELNVPITDQIELIAAGRYDRYDSKSSELGGAFTPQIQLTYRPVDSLLMRATWGETFKAPDMHAIFTDSGFYSSTVDYRSCWDNQKKAFLANNPDGTFDDNAFDSGDCDGTSSFGFRKGNNKLKDERGDTYGFGLAWDATENLSLTADYYYLELNNLVVSESMSTYTWNELACDDSRRGQFLSDSEKPTAGDCALANTNVYRTTDATTGISSIDRVDVSPVNKASQSTSGIDANLLYNLETELGKFALSMNYTHVLSSKYQATVDSENEEIRDKGWNRAARSNLTSSLTYMPNDDWAFTLTQYRKGSIPFRYQSELDDEVTNDGETVLRHAPHFTYNLVAQYYAAEDLQVKLSVRNLFDEKPPADSTFQAYQWPWYDVFAYGGGAIGREVFLEASYKF